MTTDRFKQIIMENVFKTSASPTYSIPTTYYLGLSTSTATSGEPQSSTGYARINLTSGYKLTYNTSTKKVTNNVDITFDNSAGSSDWFATGSPAAYYIITDSATSGNILAYGQLSTAKSILAGDTAKIASGDLQISISDNDT